MMTVVGEEGTPIDDFAIMLKADFFDNCYLQQDAFDEVDGATSAERQGFVFDKVLEILRQDFDFDDKQQARDVLLHAQDMFRNWNFAAEGTDEYKSLLERIDTFIEKKGRVEKKGND